MREYVDVARCVLAAAADRVGDALCGGVCGRCDDACDAADGLDEVEVRSIVREELERSSIELFARGPRRDCDDDSAED